MNIPPRKAQAQAILLTSNTSTVSSSPLTERAMDQSTPFDGDHQGSFDPSAIDFSTNIGINTGTFVRGPFELENEHYEHAARIQGLDSLGNCQNSENACLDQRCYHVISSAAASSRAPGVEKINDPDTINLEDDMPLVGLQSNPNNPSATMAYATQNIGQPMHHMSQMNQMSQASTTEPMAALQSLHDTIHEGIFHTPNQPIGQTSIPGPATALHSLHHNFHQPSNQFPTQSTCQGFNQQLCHPFSSFPNCQAVNQFPNQTFQPNFPQSLDQLQDVDMFMDNAPTQWMPNTGTNWGTMHPAPGGMPGAAPLGAPVSCSSQCGRIECASQCGESVGGDCCFNPSCGAVDANHLAAVSNCCSNESCQDPEPCMEENCQEAFRPCNDVSCMETTVSNTPVSASVPTPPATESDPMRNHIATPIDGAGHTMVGVMANSFTPPVAGNTMDTVLALGWGPPVMASKAVAPSVESSMGENDQFRCRWMCDSGLCGEVFQKSEDLQNHCKKEHAKNLVKEQGGGFVCKWHGCTRKTAFAQKSKLERHTQTHTGFKPVRCKICDLKLSAKQSLDQHMRTHSGDMPWKCQHPGCGKAFKQQSALTMHKRTHTGEKPLKCEICSKTFSESSNLSKHRRTHNVKGNHVCEYCSKDFHRLDQLRRHLRTTHKINSGDEATPQATSSPMVGVERTRM
ncbi:hypothetical protein B0T10DRAFT_118071 [Thelonectria olida]|uniref:C2H2-type domain-containing protein n=1 Tax=Thelonectria olida TaxID=1576542 RepID=A0A9P8WGM8_9HYPO|nr:hypothetical protein B0T10DRAFT_118071 [Thelonectria olida]